MEYEDYEERKKLLEEPKLSDLSEEIGTLLEGADREAFSKALAEDDVNALAEALHVSPEKLQEVADKALEVGSELRSEYKMVAKAAELLEEQIPLGTYGKSRVVSPKARGQNS